MDNPIATFARAVVRHAADGFSHVDEATRAARLAECAACSFAHEGRCLLCGCVLAVKAGWATEDCPDGRWPVSRASPAAEPETPGGPRPPAGTRSNPAG